MNSISACHFITNPCFCVMKCFLTFGAPAKNTLIKIELVYNLSAVMRRVIFFYFPSNIKAT